MARIAQIIGRLLPRGSTLKSNGSFKQCPDWPPDLFAVMAVLVETSGFYAELPFTAGWEASEYVFEDSYLQEVTTVGKRWATTGVPPQSVKKLWSNLLKFADLDLGEGRSRKPSWELLAIRLLAIADEACVGIGFAPDGEGGGIFPRLVFEQQIVLAQGRTPSLQFLPSSLCQMVSNREVCVQPKTNVPVVGCTLRSLSHHLALLPPISTVATSWLFMHPAENDEKPFNLILIPFPFSISGNDFIGETECADQDNCFFSMGLGWVLKNGRPVRPKEIADLICTILETAKQECDQIHGVVLPETALFERQAEAVAIELAKRNRNLELFVSGVLSTSEGQRGKPRNNAYTARLHQGKVLDRWLQSKHHRWRLESSQIVRYHLGPVLDPGRNWWEKIDVGNRTCVFTVVRPGASLAVLICEDLARFDPVMPVINAVGPNLVIALLMDGPQLERRWPGRYATVLADDPGSSVLTLTCLGMIGRASMPGDDESRQIALWKQAGDIARELKLPRGHHAMLLSLTVSDERQVTLDRRTDEGGTRRFKLAGARSVKIDRAALPPWIRVD